MKYRLRKKAKKKVSAHTGFSQLLFSLLGWECGQRAAGVIQVIPLTQPSPPAQYGNEECYMIWGFQINGKGW